MDSTARNVLALAALIFLPLLHAYCPRLAPDVISGKIIPCRYLCIRINFFEMPSIILSTERDGVLCSTLLLRRRGVCKNGGCVPFDGNEYKGALGKAFSAIDTFASGSFKKAASKSGAPSGPIVDNTMYTGSSIATAGPVVPAGSPSPTSPPVAGSRTGGPGVAPGLPFLPKSNAEPALKFAEASSTPSIYPNLKPNAGMAPTGPATAAASVAAGPPVVPLTRGGKSKSENQASPPPTALQHPGDSPRVGSREELVSANVPTGGSPSGTTSVPSRAALPTATSTGGGSAGAASGGASGAGGASSRVPNANAETSLASIYGLPS